MFDFPEIYNGEDKGKCLSEAQLEEVAIESGALNVQTEDHPYLDDDLKAGCKDIMPNPEEVLELHEAADAYLYLLSKLL